MHVVKRGMQCTVNEGKKACLTTDTPITIVGSCTKTAKDEGLFSIVDGRSTSGHGQISFAIRTGSIIIQCNRGDSACLGLYERLL